MCSWWFGFFIFFFFKQKTAYEMRISDWSSDVCSSDLGFPDHGRHAVRCLAWRHRARCADHFGAHHQRQTAHEIGRASCRERVCQYVSISVVAVSLKKTKNKQNCQYTHDSTKPQHTIILNSNTISTIIPENKHKT